MIDVEIFAIAPNPIAVFRIIAKQLAGDIYSAGSRVSLEKRCLFQAIARGAW
jgi:hypothetical protein